jgi:hypothetical protein
MAGGRGIGPLAVATLRGHGHAQLAKKQLLHAVLLLGTMSRDRTAPGSARRMPCAAARQVQLRTRLLQLPPLACAQ